MRRFFPLAIVSVLCSLALAQEPPATDLPATDPNATQPAPATGPSGETLVTLHLTDVTPEHAVRVLNKQGRVKIHPANDNLWDKMPDQITLDVTDKPFLLALRQFCEQCKLVPQAIGPELVSLVPESAGSLRRPYCVAGPLLVTADSINTTQSIPLGQPDKATQACTLQLSVFRDPHTRVLVEGGCEITEATDDAGNSMLAPSGAAVPRTAPTGVLIAHGPVTSTVRLAFPDGTAKKLATFKATYKMTVQTAGTTLEIPDLLTTQNVTKDAGAFQVTFKKCATETIQNVPAGFPVPRGPAWGVDVQVARTDTPAARALRWMPYAGDNVRLLDAQDNELTGLAVRTIEEGARTNYHFLFMPKDTAGKPAKLVLELPAACKDIAVPVEFHNLPLP